MIYCDFPVRHELLWFPATVNLGDIAHQIISEYSRQTPERKVDFRINGDINVYADAQFDAYSTR